MKREKEIWKSIEGYPLYLVSNLGRVRSCYTIPFICKRTMIPEQRNMTFDPKILSSYFSDGRLMVSLRRDGKTLPKSLDKIVATAFLSNPHNCKHILHKDNDVYNNAASNLQWCNIAELRGHMNKNR